MEDQLNNQDRLRRTSERVIERGIRALADSLGEGLMVVQDSKVVFTNDRLEEILGMERDELSGADIRDFDISVVEESSGLTTEERSAESPKHTGYPFPRIGALHGDVSDRKDLPSARDLRVNRRDGRAIYLRDRSSQIQWRGYKAAVHFLEDITLRKSAEKQLREQQEVNSILADTVRRILASPASLTEIASTVLESAMSLTGSRSGVLMIRDGSGLKVMEQRCPGGCPVCMVPSVLEVVESNEGLMKLRRPGRIDGSFYLNHVLKAGEGCAVAKNIRNLLRVPFRNSSPVFGQILLADSPDLFGPWDLDNIEKIAEVLNLALVSLQSVEDLKTARDTAEGEARARSQFLANVSHEIRSPLNGVLMMASLLKESDLTKEQSDLLNVVMFSARTIDRLIRDLTDLTQIRTGKITIHVEDFNLEELCRHIVETNRPEAVKKGLDLDLHVHPEAVHFCGDRERTGQIVSNLLINAVKFTDHGFVKLKAGIEKGELRIDVLDSGIGIPVDQHEEVFGLFHQGKTRRTAEGTGIGLAVVKELTGVMNGRVILESRPGDGSMFSIFLPPGEMKSGSTEVEEPSIPAASANCSRILVVEDEGVNRLYLRTFLERDGWKVDEAADGLEAVSMAEKNVYELVLMDISMPRMDGLEASSRIRKIRARLPIIAITAHAYEEDRQSILEAGVNDIILKPINENVLKKAIKNYLGNC